MMPHGLLVCLHPFFSKSSITAGKSHQTAPFRVYGVGFRDLASYLFIIVFGLFHNSDRLSKSCYAAFLYSAVFSFFFIPSNSSFVNPNFL